MALYNKTTFYKSVHIVDVTVHLLLACTDILRLAKASHSIVFGCQTFFGGMEGRTTSDGAETLRRQNRHVLICTGAVLLGS